MIQKSLFNYQIIGKDSSPKLVFLHGIMGQGRNWGSIAKKFSQKYQCLIFDQRGHGQSHQPDKGYEIDDYVEDLKSLMLEVGWQAPVRVVGHSMGGRVALMFAEKYPKWVKQLVIVDIGPSSNWQSMASILDKLESVPVPFNSRGEARAYLEGPFTEKYKSPMLMEFFYSNLVSRNDQYDWVFSKSAIRQTLELARYKDYWAEFKNLKMPTLFVRGGNSSDLSQEDYEKVLANNPHIQGEVVEGAGHWVHAEKPRETLALIDNFFGIEA